MTRTTSIGGGIAAATVLAAALALAMLLGAGPASASTQQIAEAPGTSNPLAGVSGLDATTTAVTQACKKAKRQLKTAQKKLKKAKKSGNKKKIKKAKKKIKKAKKKKKKACSRGGGPSEPNRPPEFQEPLLADSTRVEYSYSGGILIAARGFLVLNPAIDPDGDKLTYTWDASQLAGASNATNICAGLNVFGRDCDKSGPEPSATWVVYADPFQCIPEGRANVTVSDGKGGNDEGTITFESNC